jgi:hypothetical protein
MKPEAKKVTGRRKLCGREARIFYATQEFLQKVTKGTE